MVRKTTLEKGKTPILKTIEDLYRKGKEKIEERLEEFRKMGKYGTEEDLFAELAFCLFTPQSKARLCWDVVETLRRRNLLLNGEKEKIATELNKVRFKNKKAEYLCLARELFTTEKGISIRGKLSPLADPYEKRDWLVKHVKGMGYKEASHFLRNIGYGENFAILDRHILRNFYAMGVIRKIPESISRKKYLQIEEKIQIFAKRISIPLCHLDLLLWYKETGEIFK
jgi:N-glycosylase/DNA lyase